MIPLRCSARAGDVRLGVLDREAERGDMVRRGADLDFRGVGDLANAEFSWRERVRPRSGEVEGIGQDDQCERKLLNVYERGSILSNVENVRQPTTSFVK